VTRPARAAAHPAATLKTPQQKSPQQLLVDQVAAEPAWADSSDAAIIAEARRREAASRAPR
jgi:hypothetical protein